MAGKQTMKTSIDFSICQRDKQSGYVRVLDPSTGSHIVAVNINGKIHIYCGSVRQVGFYLKMTNNLIFVKLSELHNITNLWL